MPGDADPSPVLVGLPEPLDRRMRLGPFPSVGQALKFGAYVGVGAVAAALIGPVGWLPFLGVGFFASTYRRGGKSADERVADFLAFQLRQRSAAGAPRDRGARVSGDFVRVAQGARVAILVARGVPVAFLPPSEARRLFDGFRQLLDGTEASIYLVAGLRPMRDAPFLPPRERVPGASVDAMARAGYVEMMRAVCRRRARRRVTIAVWSPGPAEGEELRLLRSVRRVTEGLERLEIPVERLTETPLRAEADRLGLGGGAS